MRALAAAGFFLVGLAAWLTIVAPANTELATWTPGPLPDNFQAVQWRWEGGHMLIAVLKFLGFLFAVSAILLMRRER